VIKHLPKGQRRGLALLILGLVALVLAAALWFPLAYLRRQDAALAAGERRLAELRARIPAREELLAQERRLAQSVDVEHALLPGSTPAVAAAQLQGDLAGLAAAMGGEITTVQILEPEPVPPFVRIGLRLSLSGDTATVRDFLYAVETRDPVLLVRSMNLADTALSGATDSPENPVLAATFELYGYAPGAILP
jgi:Type II secretion system (T2SS), protein M subtype b